MFVEVHQGLIEAGASQSAKMAMQCMLHSSRMAPQSVAPFMKGHAAIFAWCTGIVCFSAWVLWCMVTPSESAGGPDEQGGKDLQAYRRIVVRVHGGEAYYAAAGE